MRKTARNMLSLLIVLAFAFNALPLGAARPVYASSSGVVISQVFGAGAADGQYTHDFIELFNAGTNPVSLAGWSVQYASASGTGLFGGSTTQITPLPDVTLQPGQYYLIAETSGTPDPKLPTPDLTDSSPINLSYIGGKVALAKIATSLGCNGSTTPCTEAQLVNIEDLLGYGATGFYEGTNSAFGAGTLHSVQRNEAGCMETDDNRADFNSGAPVPHNTASPIHLCGELGDVPPIVTYISPGDGDTDVAANTVILIDFSEPVNLAEDWFTFTCDPGIAPSLNVQPGTNTSFYLNHNVKFPDGAVCTFSIPDPSKVTDKDYNADSMEESFSFSFTVDLFPLCELPTTPIYDVQGSGATTPLAGQIVHVEGAVVGDFEDPTTGMKGFYLQELYGDGDPNTSDGIFVYNNNTENRVHKGELVHVVGTAGEAYGQTQISNVTDWEVCSLSTYILPVDVELPVKEGTLFEPYEGMLVSFPQELVIAEYFEYDRYGEIVLALPLEGESRPFTSTAIDEPGPAANARAKVNSLRRITLDDNIRAENPTVLRHPNGLPFSLENRFRGGDTVRYAVGVLGYAFGEYRVFPTGTPLYTPVNMRPAAPEAVGGEIRVSAMNTLNYFLTGDPKNDSSTNNDPTDDICGPSPILHDCRGWDVDQPNELSRQRAKLLKALEGLNADVIGLNELENSTGVEPLADIVAGLPGYNYIETGTIGTDAIKVGIIYRTAAVTPVGSYKTIDSTVDPRFLETKNRPSLAQTFTVNATDEKFTVVVNHLKSKGSDCNAIGDPDTGDGQGNCSQTRANAAAALVDWLAMDPTGSGDPDFIILGDLNSYAMEDTIDAIKAGADDTVGTNDDYINLIAKFQGTYAYSYIFDGEAGYLDHALASTSMAAQVTGATEWHINSDEPDILDYDTTYKPAAQEALFELNPFRSSDHDPVIVGLALGASPVNNAPVASDNMYETDEDTPLTITAPGVLANDTDVNGDTLTATLDAQPQNGSVVIESTGQFTYTPVENFHGTDTFTYTVSDGELTDTAMVTITVKPINDAPAAADNSYETNEDTPMTVLTPGVLANDTDVDGDPITAGNIIGVQHGSLWMETNGEFRYTPDANFHGTETFNYTVSDSKLTDTGTVIIEVKPVNDGPAATNDMYKTDEDTVLTIPGPGVLENDTDLDSDTITAAVLVGPAHGTLVMNSDGGFVYTPDANFYGTDSFTYTVSDGDLTDTASVTITVKAIDDLPVAVITANKLDPEEGELVTFTASLVDPVTEEPVDFSDGAEIDWAFETGHTGSGVVAQHAFSDEDAYMVTLNVDDPVYGALTATTTVLVKNANPTIDPIAPITIIQLGSIEQAGTFTDPGQDEQFTATVDYGDGTSTQPLVLGDGTFNLAHQYLTAGDFTITIVLSDGDGGEDTLTITVTVKARHFIFLPLLQR